MVRVGFWGAVYCKDNKEPQTFYRQLLGPLGLSDLGFDACGGPGGCENDVVGVLGGSGSGEASGSGSGVPGKGLKQPCTRD